MDISIIRQLLIAALPILVAITFHEVAHGWIANKLGDPTAKMMGRVTLNPLVHIDPVGTILVPALFFILSHGTFMFGSAKPVPVNFYNLRHPRRDSALVSVAGPSTNIILSFLSILLLILVVNLLPASSSSFVATRIAGPLKIMIQYSINFNIFLAAFNLIPIPPLDGGRIAASLLPVKYSYHFEKLEPYGIIIVVILWVTGLAQYIIAPLQALIEVILRLLLLPFGGLL